MLDASALQQVKSYLDRLVNPITLTFAGDASEASEQIRSLLSDLASVSKLITVADAPADLQVRRPSFTISRTGENMGIRFAALPMGHEFSSLILALLQASGYPSKSAPDLLNRVRGLQGDYDFVVYMSLSCHNCPDVVQALNLMAVLNPNVRVTTVDGALFQDEVKERRIMAVPTVFLNGKEFNERAANELLEQAVALMAQAKSCHDELETYYRAAVDFEAVNAEVQKCAEMLQL